MFEDKKKTWLDRPATDKNSADTQYHGSYSVEQFETPVVNRDLVRGDHSGDHLGEGTHKHVCHGVSLVTMLSSHTDKHVCHGDYDII